MCPLLPMDVYIFFDVDLGFHNYVKCFYNPMKWLTMVGDRNASIKHDQDFPKSIMASQS